MHPRPTRPPAVAYLQLIDLTLESTPLQEGSGVNHVALGCAAPVADLSDAIGADDRIAPVAYTSDVSRTPTPLPDRGCRQAR